MISKLVNINLIAIQFVFLSPKSCEIARPPELNCVYYISVFTFNFNMKGYIASKHMTCRPKNNIAQTGNPK